MMSETIICPVCHTQCQSKDGMTLREYFAAHAPREPSWFDSGYDVPEPINAVSGSTSHKDRAEFAATMKKWKAERDAHQFFAWRWHYADMMITTKEPADV